MVSASQIRERILLFLNGQVDLESFENWIIQNTWNVHFSGSQAAEELTFAVEESLSEYSSGHLSAEELRSEFRELLGSEIKTVEAELAQQYQTVFRFTASPASKLISVVVPRADARVIPLSSHTATSSQALFARPGRP
jgi:hypothetical protein